MGPNSSTGVPRRIQRASQHDREEATKSQKVTEESRPPLRRSKRWAADRAASGPSADAGASGSARRAPSPRPDAHRLKVGRVVVGVAHRASRPAPELPAVVAHDCGGLTLDQRAPADGAAPQDRHVAEQRKAPSVEEVLHVQVEPTPAGAPRHCWAHAQSGLHERCHGPTSIGLRPTSRRVTAGARPFRLLLDLVSSGPRPGAGGAAAGALPGGVVSRLPGITTVHFLSRARRQRWVPRSEWRMGRRDVLIFDRAVGVSSRPRRDSRRP